MNQEIGINTHTHIYKHSHLYSPRVLDITGRAELRTKMDTQQPIIYMSEQIIQLQNTNLSGIYSF